MPEVSLSLRGGFPHLDLHGLWPLAEAESDERKRELIFQTAQLQWLEALLPVFGESWTLSHQPECWFLLAAPPTENDGKRRLLMDLAAKIIGEMNHDFPSLFKPQGCGFIVVLLFTDHELYYRYVESFENGHPLLSGGMFCGGRNPHILINGSYQGSAEATLIHELAHLLLHHRQLPLWLDEALAMAVERRFGSRSLHLVDGADELRQHLSLWNERSIQDFWSGRSWQEDQDLMSASYFLAHLLLERLLSFLGGDRRRFEAFASTAKWHDGGAAACLEVCGTSLGSLISLILGTGEWEPLSYNADPAD
jgi:hypothetical protein